MIGIGSGVDCDQIGFGLGMGLDCDRIGIGSLSGAMLRAAYCANNTMHADN